MTVPTAKYLRISEDPHNERLGVTRQNEDLDERFRRRGLPIPGLDDTYNDNNISASKFSRKPRTEYRRLLAAIEAGRYDGGVIGMAVEDRTHRQTLELAEFINLCREHNITPITPYIEYDPNDPDQVSMWFIKVRFAEAEVELGELNTGGRRRFGFVGTGKQQSGQYRDTNPIQALAGRWTRDAGKLPAALQRNHLQDLDGPVERSMPDSMAAGVEGLELVAPSRTHELPQTRHCRWTRCLAVSDALDPCGIIQGSSLAYYLTGQSPLEGASSLVST